MNVYRTEFYKWLGDDGDDGHSVVSDKNHK